MVDFSKINYSGLSEKGLGRHSFTAEQLEKAGVSSGFVIGNLGGKTNASQNRAIIVGVLVFFGLLTSMITIATWSRSGAVAILFPILFGVFIMTSLIGMYISNRNQYRFLKFAIDNGFIYRRNDYDVPVGPMLFSVGHSKSASNSLQINDAIKLSYYSYKVGSGKNEQTITIEFAKIKLPRKVPHLYLNGKQNYLSADVGNYKTEQLKMEGDFNKYFSVYTPPDYQVDILQILTPDVMLALQDFGAKYDYETIGDDLYIYSSKGTMADEVKLRDWLTAISAVEGQINKQVKTYSDARAGNVSSGLVDGSGARFKRTGWTMATGGIAFVIVIAAVHQILQIGGSISPVVMTILLAIMMIIVIGFAIVKFRKK